MAASATAAAAATTVCVLQHISATAHRVPFLPHTDPVYCNFDIDSSQPLGAEHAHTCTTCFIWDNECDVNVSHRSNDTNTFDFFFLFWLKLEV